MKFSGDTLKQDIFVVLHYLSGLFALGSAYFYLTSDALPYTGVALAGANRPKAMICGFFLCAAYLLVSSAQRHDRQKQKVLGYACIGTGFATVWLIFEGSSIGL